ncbi:hypothetical protein CDD83_9480 [Cordyceps sp. RAO-2017]|nr:hypothetical protein CDD83_9480 [Cordyceps sp. RAO-2017]
MLTTALLLLASAVLPSVAAPADSCEAEPTAPSLPQTGTGHELPPPRPGLRLKHIALGFGIQNYTCARPGAEATSTGALAMLYDITHLGCRRGRWPATKCRSTCARGRAGTRRRAPMRTGPSRPMRR